MPADEGERAARQDGGGDVGQAGVTGAEGEGTVREAVLGDVGVGRGQDGGLGLAEGEGVLGRVVGGVVGAAGLGRWRRRCCGRCSRSSCLKLGLWWLVFAAGGGCEGSPYRGACRPRGDGCWGGGPKASELWLRARSEGCRANGPKGARGGHLSSEESAIETGFRTVQYEAVKLARGSPVDSFDIPIDQDRKLSASYLFRA